MCSQSRTFNVIDLLLQLDLQLDGGRKKRR